MSKFGVGADSLAERKAVQTGHPDIRDDESRSDLLQKRECCFPIARLDHPIVLIFQQDGDDLEYSPFIFDN